MTGPQSLPRPRDRFFLLCSMEYEESFVRDVHGPYARPFDILILLSSLQRWSSYTKRVKRAGLCSVSSEYNNQPGAPRGREVFTASVGWRAPRGVTRNSGARYGFVLMLVRGSCVETEHCTAASPSHVI